MGDFPPVAHPIFNRFKIGNVRLDRYYHAEVHVNFCSRRLSSSCFIEHSIFLIAHYLIYVVRHVAFALFAPPAMVNQRNKTKKDKATPTLFASSEKGHSKPVLKLRLHRPREASPVDKSVSQNGSIRSEITPPPPVQPEDISAAKEALSQLLGSRTHRQ